MRTYSQVLAHVIAQAYNITIIQIYLCSHGNGNKSTGAAYIIKIDAHAAPLERLQSTPASFAQGKRTKAILAAAYRF